MHLFLRGSDTEVGKQETSITRVRASTGEGTWSGKIHVHIAGKGTGIADRCGGGKGNSEPLVLD